MAKVKLEGDYGTVELTMNPEDGKIVASCLAERCTWTEEYDSWGDAINYASDHVDPGMGHCDTR